MDTPYRVSLLNMLRPERVYIDSEISALETKAASVRAELKKRAIFQIIWIGLLITLSLIFLLISTQKPSIVALVAAFFPFISACFVAHSPLSSTLSAKLSQTPGLKKYHKELAAIDEHISSLYGPAKEYQQLLEPNSAPGFLAIYRDIILHPFFQSDIQKVHLNQDIELSLQGKGMKIPARRYGKVIQALKSFNFDFYFKTTKSLGVDILKAKAKTSISLQCAYIIASCVKGIYEGFKEAQLDQIYFVGLNAWVTTSTDGLPPHWNHTQNSLFSAAGEVFNVFHESSKLQKASSDFLELVAHKKANNNFSAQALFNVA